MSATARSSFTEQVRQELAGTAFGTPDEVRAELAELLRAAGTLRVVGGPDPHRELVATTFSGAVARRAYVLLGHRYRLRPELLVRDADGGLRARTYGVRVVAGADQVAAELGLLSAPAAAPTEDAALPAARLRGAMLGGGSVSTPGRAPHLELTASTTATAHQLAGWVAQLTGGHAAVSEAARVVVKSGESIGRLLAGVGASSAFLAFDERRLRRQLRGDANRLANADAANVRRSIEAASAQVDVVERAIAEHGWNELDDELRAVALARLANPVASLAELGALVEPAVSKSVVHRRVRRLEQLAASSM